MRANYKPFHPTVAALAAGAALLGALLGPSVAAGDSIALSWTAPGDDGTVGQASSYEMRYSETPVPGDTTGWWGAATSVGTMPAPLPAGTRESFIVTGLAAGKTYYFVLRASDEVPNVSGYSNVAVRQTSGGSALATPANFTGNVVPGAIVLAWDAVAPGGPELGYHLYRAGSGGGAPVLLATMPLNRTSWTDSTALGGEAYDFSLATYADSAEGAPATLSITVPSDRLLTSTETVHGYPNPARDEVTFRISIKPTASTAPTRVTVFDLTGHKICLLADLVLSPGEHALRWPCRSDGGDKVAPGLYNVIVDGPSGRAVTRVAIVP